MTFGATDELVVRGVSAARDDDRERARFYLEWALRDAPDAAQLVEARYWLSRIAPDVEERRRCLARVLGAEPTHAEARRDLAILDGRLDEGDLLDPREMVAPLMPGGPLVAGEVRGYRCPNCGGTLIAGAARGGLSCQFCGYRGRADGGTPAEQDWEAAIHTARGHRWILPRESVLECQGCGATQTLPPGRTSAICAFCGSAQVAEIAAPAGLIAPTGVVPFAFDRAGARRRAREWLAARQFRPADLDERAALADPHPIHLSFWTFDLEGQVRWRGSAETAYAARGPDGGEERVSHDDLLVPAGATLPSETLAALRFDTRSPMAYAPELLAGWPAELYRVAPAAASLLARERAIDDFRERLRGQHGEEAEDAVVESVGLAVVSYKLLLLPVWVTGYRYEGRDFRLTINGQSGVGHGEVPRGPVGRLLAWIADDDEGGR